MIKILGKKANWRIGVVWAMVIFGGMLAMPATSFAVPPVVKTVPFVPGNPVAPHTTWSGKVITLKGTSDVQGAGIQYEWDFGDGSPPVVGTVSNQYVIEASHAYTGSSGDVINARLTVTNTGTGESASASYFIIIQDQTLENEVNVAIDEGLWYLHKTQRRHSGNLGDWLSGGNASYSYYSVTAANINAFEVQGHLESGNPSNPYTETVARAMRQLFNFLTTEPISNQTYPAPTGTVDPDSNGNGLGVRVNQSYPPYQGGMIMDAIIASGTPDAQTTTGPAGIINRKYMDIVQDMVDSYAYGQYSANTAARGGWRYNWQSHPDNSACQWAAIGLIPAERNWGLTVPAWVKLENQNWLNYSQHSSGWFGYTGLNTAWGYYATTPSGMVQLAMDGIGRGDSRWDISESWIRDRFCNTGGPTNAIRDYYYGLFSFTKAMLLHDSNGDGVGEPIDLLQSTTSGSGLSPIDWYAAEFSAGDQCDGVARTLVNDQHPLGYWYGHNYSSAQYFFETGWAIVMLVKTDPGSLPPTAIAQALPNPALADQLVTLDGSASRANASGASIVLWEWDLGCDDSYELNGPVVHVVSGFSADTCVRLKVTDDQATNPLSDEAEITVRIVPPPVPPTADADGPYVFCPQTQPWFLDGTGSVNPDEGISENAGLPGNTIIEYAWDLDSNGQFNDALGPQPDATSFFTALGPGLYPIQLRVTDNSSLSHPVSSGGTDLSDNSLPTVVLVLDAADPACSSCVNDLTARAKSGKVQLVWTDTGAASYNVYRSTTMGGPYTIIANTTSTYSTYLDADVTDGITYYYVVREVALNTDELCQSNEVSATPTARVRSR